MAEKSQNPGDNLRLCQRLDQLEATVQQEHQAQQPQGTSDLDLLDRFIKAVAVTSSSPGGEINMHVMPDRLIPIIERQIRRIEERIRLLSTTCLLNLELLSSAKAQETHVITYQPEILKEIPGGYRPATDYLKTRRPETHRLDQQFQRECEGGSSRPPWREFQFVCSHPQTADSIRKKIQSLCFDVSITGKDLDSIKGSINDGNAISIFEDQCVPGRSYSVADDKFPTSNVIERSISHTRINVISGYECHDNYDVFRSQPIRATVFTVNVRVRNCTECRINPQNKDAKTAALEAEKEVDRLQVMRQKLEEAIVKLVTKIT